MSEAAPAEGVKVPKAAELVAAQLRRQIVLGERAEGELFPPELKLMTELGVSRPTLRQALRILTNEHLVQVQRGRGGGTRVSRPSADTAGRYLNHLLLFQGATLEDVLKAQLLIEPSAVAEIARSLDDEAIASLREAVADNRAETDPDEAGRLRADFHVRLVELTGNRSLTLFARLVSSQLGLPRKRQARAKQVPTDTSYLDDHSRLIDLLQAGAAREAARHWREHLRSSHEQLQRTVDTRAPLDLKS